MYTRPRLAALLLGALTAGPGVATAAPATGAAPAAHSDPGAPAPASVEEAARRLSRFSPRQVPDLPVLLAAVDTLGRSGDRAVLPLLDELAATERGALHHAASDAGEHLRASLRAAQRRDFRASLPGPVDEQVWIRGHALAGRSPGPVEAGAIAYAHLVLGLDDAVPLRDGAVLAPATIGWDIIGQLLEDDEDPRGALAMYAAAAIDGRPGAAEEIAGFGVDAVRLVLGLQAGALGPGGRGVVQRRLGSTLQDGSGPAAAVLIERVEAPAPDVRADAIEDLCALLRRGELQASTAEVARARLEAARRDPLPRVQEVARDAIVELELAEILPR